MMVGYARVSSVDQDTALQVAALRRSGVAPTAFATLYSLPSLALALAISSSICIVNSNRTTTIF